MLSDDASGFVSLSEAVPDVILEIRYYSTFNFVGSRIAGYEEPVALLTRQAADALKAASDEARDQGYRIKVYDAYRPQMAVDHFVRWAADPHDTRMKAYFYPNIDKSALIPGGYIAAQSGHSRGSTVDLTLFDMRTQRELDMGSPFDFFGEVSHTECRRITDAQHQNRMHLQGLMKRHGFRPLEEEWWHFSLADDPYPDTWFAFPSGLSALKRQESSPRTD